MRVALEWLVILFSVFCLICILSTGVHFHSHITGILYFSQHEQSSSTRRVPAPDGLEHSQDLVTKVF